ncbi:hypothetical protein [Diaphorobacter sp.]|uniref:hypothetical protein n=1 Tax=Diaphorobacter sp. TaxID=1934310 RepID=UPI0028AC2221|nr:hypothetical protein [Diaphorobacter sp.]
MFTLKDQYGKKLVIADPDEFQDFFKKIPSGKWSSGSGDICLLNNDNGFYISISKIGVGDRYIITSAEKFGDDLYVYVSSKNYTTTVEYSVGGESVKFPSEFFVEENFVYKFASELIHKGYIEFSGNWVVLHQQEWPGMEDDF